MFGLLCFFLEGGLSLKMTTTNTCVPKKLSVKSYHFCHFCHENGVINQDANGSLSNPEPIPADFCAGILHIHINAIYIHYGRAFQYVTKDKHKWRLIQDCQKQDDSAI